MTFYPPPGHPCFSHGCDGCSTCVAGACCGQGHTAIALGAKPGLPVLDADALEAVRDDAEGRHSRLDLVRADALRRFVGTSEATRTAAGLSFAAEHRQEEQRALPPSRPADLPISNTRTTTPVRRPEP